MQTLGAYTDLAQQHAQIVLTGIAVRADGTMNGTAFVLQDLRTLQIDLSKDPCTPLGTPRSTHLQKAFGGEYNHFSPKDGTQRASGLLVVLQYDSVELQAHAEGFSPFTSLLHQL